MLAGAGAAARMMRYFHQRQIGDTEKFGLGLAKFHKNRLAESDCRLSVLLKLDGVVDTPRCA